MEQRISACGYETGERAISALATDAACLVLTALLVRLLMTRGMASPDICAGASFGYSFLVGLTCSPHCLGMCGGVLLTQTAGAAKRAGQINTSAAYNGGRVISYTALGAIFGALGTVISYTVSIKSMVFTMLGLAIALMGLHMWGLLPGLSMLAGGQAVCRLSAGIKQHFVGRPLIVGLLTGLMPCGSLYVVWSAAMAGGSASAGAVTMLGFALGTVPLLALFGSFGALLPPRLTKYARKLGAVLVTAIGVKMLLTGLLLLR